MTVRAKFRCTSLEHFTTQPSGPRTFKFTAEYDPSVPEDQRYAQYTPSGSLTIHVDNPAVSFTPGQSYYLDFTPVDAG